MRKRTAGRQRNLPQSLMMDEGAFNLSNKQKSSDLERLEACNWPNGRRLRESAV